MHTLAVIALVVVLIIVLIGCGVHMRQQNCRRTSAAPALCPARAAGRDADRKVYRKYRVTFPEIANGSIMQIADIELLGKQPPLPSVVKMHEYDKADVINGPVRFANNYNGGVYCPKTKRVYFIPTAINGGVENEFFYVDCNTGMRHTYSQRKGIGSMEYSGGVYCPVNRRIYLVPSPQTAGGYIGTEYFHYIDCENRSIEQYRHGISAGVPHRTIYSGGAYDPSKERIYFVPYRTQDREWMYVDCNNGTISRYSLNVDDVDSVLSEASYSGAVHVESQKRIYLMPHGQTAQPKWHYIDCNGDTPTVQSYDADTDATLYPMYDGGVYHPQKQRIYLVPSNVVKASEWHYIDCSEDTPTVQSYTHNLDPLYRESNNGMQFKGGVYSPLEDRIYFIPYMASTLPFWIYLDCADDLAKVYVSPYYRYRHEINSNLFSNAVYAPSQRRIYLVPSGMPYLRAYIDVELDLRPLHDGSAMPYAPQGRIGWSPRGEGVYKALDGTPETKYLNFGGAGTGLEFDLSKAHRIGAIYLTSGNDRRERDPKRVRVEGFNDQTMTYDLIDDRDVPVFTDRKQEQKIELMQVDPQASYKRVRVTFPEVTSSWMVQVADVQLATTQLLKIPMSTQQPPQSYSKNWDQSPWRERVGNALDRNPHTKYLNFGGAGSGLVVELLKPAQVHAVLLTSGNDHKERDPTQIKLEGLDDDGKYKEVAVKQVPEYTARKQTQLIMLDDNVTYREIDRNDYTKEVEYVTESESNREASLGSTREPRPFSRGSRMPR